MMAEKRDPRRDPKVLEAKERGDSERKGSMSRQQQANPEIGVDLASGPDVSIESYWEECPACFGTKVIELLRESIPCTLCTNGMVLIKAIRHE